VSVAPRNVNATAAEIITVENWPPIQNIEKPAGTARKSGGE
jgi:hypothetical protein